MCKQEIASQAELFSPPSCSLLGAQVALAEPEANLARKIGGMSDIPKARQLVLTVADQADLGAEHHQMLVVMRSVGIDRFHHRAHVPPIVSGGFIRPHAIAFWRHPAPTTPQRDEAGARTIWHRAGI